MAKKIYKLWSIDPNDPDYKELMASFELDEDGKITADIRDQEIKDRVKNGFYTDDGKLTFEDNGPEFLELLAANYVMSSCVGVEIR